MKKVGILLFIIFILLGCRTILPNNQIRSLNGFLDIAWEENISNVVNILNENNFIITYIIEDYIQAEGIFMNEETMDFIFNFFDDRFYSADIRPKDRSRSLELYNKINTIFTNKYGKPSYVKSNPEMQMLNHWNFDNNCDITTTFYPEFNGFIILYTNIKIYREKNKIY
jgi:glycogen debranching enzyme